jgi:hypothetical protein
MNKIISIILMLLFALVSIPAWSEIGRYTTATPTPQDGTMRVQDIQITNVVTEGTACPENGRMARDANGTPLFCQSGHWASATATGGKYICSGIVECGFSEETIEEYDKVQRLWSRGLVRDHLLMKKIQVLRRENNSNKTQWFIVVDKGIKIPKPVIDTRNSQQVFKEGQRKAARQAAREAAGEEDYCELIGYLDDGEIKGNVAQQKGNDFCTIVLPVPPGSTGKIRRAYHSEHPLEVYVYQ